MYPTLPSNEVGVLIEDRKGKVYREIREALRERRVVILRKKQRFDLQAALDKIAKNP